jgi:hypothetical protein
VRGYQVLCDAVGHENEFAANSNEVGNSLREGSFFGSFAAKIFKRVHISFRHVYLPFRFFHIYRVFMKFFILGSLN